MIYTRSIVRPRTRADLHLAATEFRRKYGLNDAYVDVARLVGLEMQKKGEFYVDIRDDEEFPRPMSDPDSQIIYLPNSVHDGMIRKKAHARELVMKEVAHCCLHRASEMILRNKDALEEIQCSDWQGITFAEEILGHRIFIPRASNAEIFARLTGISTETSERLWKNHTHDALFKNKEREAGTSLSFDHGGGS